MSNQFVLLKNRGLFTFPNELSEDPAGAHREANNVVIDRESVVEPRRGIAKFGQNFSAVSTDRANQIIEYKNRLLVQYGGKLAYDSTGLGDFVDYGTDVFPADIYRLKSIESNGNLYFLTSDGPKKLSAETTEQLDFATIVDAGVPRALSLSGQLVSGTIIDDSVDRTVGYQLVWGYTDFNGNLILGAPSGTFTLSNEAASGSKNAEITFFIPKEIINSPIADRFFYQLYRSPLVDGIGSEVGGDFNLVLEDFITDAQRTAGTVTVVDEYPETLRQTSTPLYTSSTAGEGALQANERPPFATDIETYFGYTFYANTSTVERRTITLLNGSDVLEGGQIIIDDGVNPPQTYTFTDTPALPNDVQISSSTSPSIQIFETATNLINKVNSNTNELTVYAYYDSLSGELPGRIRFEHQDLVGVRFSIVVSSNISDFFDPTITSQQATIISASTPSEITIANHGFSSGTQITVYNSNSTPSIDGVHTVTVTGPNTFTIPVDVTSAGTSAIVVRNSERVRSDNETRPNRIYYSKFQQPEAVPLPNFFDLGPRDKAILRIIALRDSLFVFKEDGIYRISGEVAPFNVGPPFDLSAILLAPDSAVVLNNQIYCLTTQGVTVVTDTGVSIISRPIEDQFSMITRDGYRFRDQTFGVAYESDRSYLLFTVSRLEDTSPTQCLRFNSFTRTWTRWTVSQTCGIVSDSITDITGKRTNDRMYLGASDGNFIERERKNRNRTDYADRELDGLIVTNGVNGRVVSLGNVQPLNIGDVVVQTQHLTLSRFNRLIRRLDLDTLVQQTNFEQELQMFPGNNILAKLTALVNKLDADTGLNDNDYSTFYIGPVGTNVEQQAYFNAIVQKLDSDPGAFFTDYFAVLESTGSIEYEGVVTAIDRNAITVTTPTALPFIEGPVVIFKRIDTRVTWSPASFGDVSLFKQVSEGTIIFEDNNFSAATVGYGTDLSPGFDNINFSGSGNGDWGIFEYGGLNWGGISSAKPLRTYVPRPKQRCRFMVVRFEHSVAREKFSLYGVSLTFRSYSKNSYR